MRTVYIICGPTSTGKTTLALNLAKDFNGEIISADSRQIYKYMDIGTGKMPVDNFKGIQKNENHWEIDGVNVWGYDLVNPNQYFSAYAYADFALKKAKKLLEQGKTVFLVGGTGLYLDIVTGNISVAQVEPNLDLRNTLEKLSNKDLLSELTSLNVERAQKVDKDNKMRLIRAIEIERGQPKNTTPLPYLTDANYVFIGLTADRKTLYTRADLWLETIWKTGLLQEVRNLITLDYGNSPKLNGLIYKSTLDYINGRVSESDAKQRAKYDIHAYIRRQQTWFKRNPNIMWFDINKENFSQNIKNLVSSTLNG